MHYPLRCRCGTVQGEVAAPRSASRAVCYCRDCQAFARYLGHPDDTLNGRGGTQIFATLPRHVRFTQGTDRLQCMSLSPKGLLRWYAGCCRTPIGNTPRDRRISYVGLVRSCLPGDESALDGAFGPVRIALNVASATGPVAATPVASFFGLLRIVRAVLGARLAGRTGENPFFDAASDQPIRQPYNLTLAERRALDART
jgi:hypothetical protein